MHPLLERLSTTLDRRDRQPNIALGKEIARTQDVHSIGEIRKLLKSGLSTDYKCNLADVLRAIGEQEPALIAESFPEVMELVHSKVNQEIWHYMIVLALIAPFKHKEIFEELGSILEVMDKGSVITRDHGFSILVSLYSDPVYKQNLRPLIVEQLFAAPDNQLGQYAEKWIRVISPEDLEELISILENRQEDLSNESHQKRISKILKRLHK